MDNNYYSNFLNQNMNEIQKINVFDDIAKHKLPKRGSYDNNSLKMEWKKITYSNCQYSRYYGLEITTFCLYDNSFITSSKQKSIYSRYKTCDCRL